MVFILEWQNIIQLSFINYSNININVNSDSNNKLLYFDCK